MIGYRHNWRKNPHTKLKKVKKVADIVGAIWGKKLVGGGWLYPITIYQNHNCLSAWSLEHLWQLLVSKLSVLTLSNYNISKSQLFICLESWAFVTTFGIKITIYYRPKKSKKKLDHLWHLLGSKSNLIIGQKSKDNAQFYRQVLRKFRVSGGFWD